MYYERMKIINPGEYWTLLYLYQKQILNSEMKDVSQQLIDDVNYAYKGSSVPKEVANLIHPYILAYAHNEIRIRKKVRKKFIEGYNKHLKNKINSEADQLGVMYDVIMDLVSEYAGII